MRQTALAGEPTVVTATFEVGETPTATTGTPTVTVTRENGDVIATDAATTVTAEPGVYAYTLTDTGVDELTLVWTGTIAGATKIVRTQVNVVGGYYFDLADLRDLPELGDTTKYPTDRLVRARRWIEGVIDRACATAFVARYRRDVFDGDATDIYGTLRLRENYALDLLGVRENAVDFTTDALNDIAWYPRRGYLERRTASIFGLYNTADAWAYGIQPWARGRRNIEVRYSHGFARTCPDDLTEAALTAARFWILNRFGTSAIPSRALSITNEFGNVQLSAADAGRRRFTGIPDVDAVIAGWADTTRVPASA